MTSEHTITLAAPLNAIWPRLAKLDAIAACVPGLELGAATPDEGREASLDTSVGPAAASLRGSVRIARIDRAAHAVTYAAHGSDRNGQGNADATIVARLAEIAGDCALTLSIDLDLSGRFTRFGDGEALAEALGRVGVCVAAAAAADDGAAAERPAAPPELTAIATQTVIEADAAHARAPGPAPDQPTMPDQPMMPDQPTVPDPPAAPEPFPGPAPVPEPMPAPVPEPRPDPVPEPTPDPVDEPTPDPVPGPSSEPISAPLPDPSAASAAVGGAAGASAVPAIEPDPFGPIGLPAEQAEEPPKRESVPPPGAGTRPRPIATEPKREGLGAKLRRLLGRK